MINGEFAISGVEEGGVVLLQQPVQPRVRPPFFFALHPCAMIADRPLLSDQEREREREKQRDEKWSR